MLRLRRLLPCLLTSVAFAETPAPEPAVRFDPLIVEEARLIADAGGTTRIRLDDTTPPPAQTLANLSNRVANFHLNTGGAGSFGDLLELRGLANTPYFSDPSVTVYFDDLPLGSSFSYPTGLFGFATASIYRGPQATAFGRAGEGGVLVFSSAEPLGSAGAELRAGAGNYAARSGALSFHTARGPSADASLAASFAERDGYITNTHLGTRVDDFQSSALSARFRFRPSPLTELSLQLLGSRLNNGAQPLVPLGGPRFTVARSREGRTRVDFGGIALKAAFDTAYGRLTATTSYTDWHLDPFTNEIVLPPPLDSSIVQTQRTWNEEIRFTSGARAARPWTLGAWFSDAKTAGDVSRAIPNLFPIEVSGFDLRARTAALFGDVTLLGVGDWHLIAGLRAETLRKDFDRREQVPAVGRFTADKTFDALLPKLTVRYALAPETTASASVSVGTKPGGWSAFTGHRSLAGFAAERTVAFEAGIDTIAHNKTVRLSARLFDYEIRDYQIERSFNATDYLVVNAPRARSRGGELEASWRPLRAWTFAATLGVTDVRLRAFTDPFTGVSYAGRRAPYSPDYDAHLSVTYHNASGWFAGAEAAFVGKIYYDESENPAFAQDDRVLLGARLGYDAPRWRLTFFGDNLADRGYWSLIIPGVGHAVPGSPRTTGVELSLKW